MSDYSDPRDNRQLLIEERVAEEHIRNGEELCDVCGEWFEDLRSVRESGKLYRVCFHCFRKNPGERNEEE